MLGRFIYSSSSISQVPGVLGNPPRPYPPLAPGVGAVSAPHPEGVEAEIGPGVGALGVGADNGFPGVGAENGGGMNSGDAAP